VFPVDDDMRLAEALEIAADAKEVRPFNLSKLLQIQSEFHLTNQQRGILRLL